MANARYACYYADDLSGPSDSAARTLFRFLRRGERSEVVVRNIHDTKLETFPASCRLPGPLIGEGWIPRTSPWSVVRVAALGVFLFSSSCFHRCSCCRLHSRRTLCSSLLKQAQLAS
jgi:hypothetical protein